MTPILTRIVLWLAVSLPASAPAAETVRFATFNASLARDAEGELTADLDAGDDHQIRRLAEIVQRVDPDVLLVNEFDYAPENPALFQRNYLAVGQNGAPPVAYPHVWIAPSNTGVPSGLDLDNDGEVGGPGDAFGFGTFPGQYGMAVFSKHPIDAEAVRTFRRFLWADMAGARLPADPEDADGNGETAAWFTAAELEVVRLSSKSHWDVPIEIEGEVIHFLVSHPTPPVFDGPEDRNGLRNADEIRFWADYAGGAAYPTDDAGVAGGLEPGTHFVVAGDLNADPFDGDSVDGAAWQLLDHALITGSATNPAITPASEGARIAAVQQGAVNAEQRGNPAFDTADFGFNLEDPTEDNPPGNVRVDYVLPSRTLSLADAGVFWPAPGKAHHELAGFPTSDHRLVWIDVEIPEAGAER